MAGTRDTYRIARVGLTALAVAMVVAIAITYLIGASKLSTAESEASDGARVLVQENLATIVTGTDLAGPVGESRAREIDALIDGTILNGEIDAVTVWEPDGTIVYSSDPDLVGTRLPEERFPLREVLKTGTTSTVQDGMFSTRVPLAPAGTDVEGVAQLDRVYAPIWESTAKPWRTASLSLSLVLLALLGAIYQVSRMASRRWNAYAGTTFQAIRGRMPAALGGGSGTDPEYAQPDFRRAEEALAKAEVRATTAEERAAALQEQYRKTLEELHAAQTKLEGAALETPSRPDPEIEERLLKAEGRVRLLEGQLQSVKSERDKLAIDMQERPAETAPDPETEQRAHAAEAEVIALRTELDAARKELEAARKEREQLAARAAEVAGLQETLATATAEHRTVTQALEHATSELTQARADAEGTVDQARAAAESRTAEAEARATEAEARAVEAEARAAEEAARTTQAETARTQAETARTQAEAQAAEAADQLRTLEAATAARMREIESAATGDVDAAAAQVQAAEARAAEANASLEAADDRAAEATAALEAADTRAAEAIAALEAARRDTAAARAEAESFRATAGTERAELEDAFRAELDTRERDLRLDAEAREAELRRGAEASEAELRASIETRERTARDQAEAELAIADERFRAELQNLRDRAETELRSMQEQTQAQLTELSERLADAEGEVEKTRTREQQLVGDLEAKEHDLTAMHTREAELEAELTALRDEAREELVTLEQELRTRFAAEQTASFAKLQAATEADRVRMEQQHAEMQGREASLSAELDELRARLEGTTTDLGATGSELESARTELDRVRAEAASFETELDELRARLEGTTTDLGATGSELESARTELDRVRAEAASFETELERVRAEAAGSTTELQTVWNELETAQRELTTSIEQVRARESELETVRAEAQTLREGTADADGSLRRAEEEVALLRQELTDARDDLVRAQGDVQTELMRASEVAGRAEAAERELQEASMRAAAAEHELEQLRGEVEIAGHELATLREIADAQHATAQERETLEEMLRVTQEHLTGSNERVTEAETKVETTEAALVAARDQVEELESRLRTIEMSQAVKSMRREDTEPSAGSDAPLEIGDAAALEDRRAGTPFMRELSLDAKKSLTSILGLSLTLKHKSQPKEQAPLLRQLAAYARRLDHTVADLLDADKLARGEVELHPRRTDLEALVERVVEESQVGNDHDVRLQTERIVASVDPVRTEQILMGLLRGATDRTPLGSAITIRLTKGEGGAMISVEDAETSSDASLSPVVKRFADIQGGWAKVESRPNGGSAFRVFLPAEGVMPDSPADQTDREIELSVSPKRTDLEIVVSDELDAERRLVAAAADDDDPWAAGQLLVQELQKLSRDD